MTLALRPEAWWYSPVVGAGAAHDARGQPDDAAADQAAAPSVVMENRATRAAGAVLDAMAEASGEGWDGYHARPADPAAVLHALHVLDGLSATIPFPEIAIDADGDVALEWQHGPRQVFSLRVSPDGTLYYAGLDGYATFHGSEPYRGDLPATVVAGIRRVAGTAAPG